jgi:hypothetical protein
LLAKIAGEAHERDFSWFDWTLPNDISEDGSFFVFQESGVGGGGDFSVFMRKTDGSPPVLLGNGNGITLSPDHKFVVTSPQQSPSQLFLTPLGAGQSRQVTNDSLDHRDAVFLPDGKHVAFFGVMPEWKTDIRNISPALVKLKERWRILDASATFAWLHSRALHDPTLCRLRVVAMSPSFRSNMDG